MRPRERVSPLDFTPRPIPRLAPTRRRQAPWYQDWWAILVVWMWVVALLGMLVLIGWKF